MSAQETEPLPRVNGRHRDKALARARKQRAIELKMQGLSYQQIADEMGYASRGSVYKIIKDAQTVQLVDAVEEHRNLELGRLDALQASLWDRAIAGDVDAVLGVLRVIESRCRLLGLHNAPKSRAGCRQPQTVVLLEDDCRLRGCPEHGLPTESCSLHVGAGELRWQVTHTT